MYVIRSLLVPYKVASSGNRLVLKKRNENRFFLPKYDQRSGQKGQSMYLFPPHTYTTNHWKIDPGHCPFFWHVKFSYLEIK